MAVTLKDRVAETSTATGNAATFNLAGAQTGYRTFVAAVGAAITTYYAIVHRTSGEWEVGIGTVTAGSPDVLNRTTVLDGSSGAGTRVNFSAGTKDVFVDLPASKAVITDEAGLIVGTLGTPAQPNVTSVGTLTGLTINSAPDQNIRVRLSGGVSALSWLNNAGSAFAAGRLEASSFIFDIGGVTINTGGLTVSSGTTSLQALTATTGAFVVGSGSPLTVEHSGVASALRVGISMKRGGLQRYVLGFNASDEMSILDAAGSTELFKLSNAGAGTFTAGLTATAVTIDQGAADGEILTLRSSDVAHGLTAITDTSTYGSFMKFDPLMGGLGVAGFTEGTIALALQANVTVGDTTKTAGALGAHYYDSFLKLGTGRTGMAANTNLVAFANAGFVKFILDADGDSHQDVGTAWTNFDTHDDIALLNLLAAKVTRRDDPLRRSFGRWMQKNRSVLTKAGLVTFNRDGHHFVNMSRLAMLHTGALRQIGAKFERLLKLLADVGVPRQLLAAI